MNVKLRDDYHKDSVTVNGYTITKLHSSYVPDKYFPKLQKTIRGLVIVKEQSKKPVKKKVDYNKKLKSELSALAKKEGVVVKSSMNKKDIIKELERK